MVVSMSSLMSPVSILEIPSWPSLIPHVEMGAQRPQDSMLQLPAYAPVMLYQPLVLLHLYLTAVLQHGVQALTQSISSKEVIHQSHSRPLQPTEQQVPLLGFNLAGPTYSPQRVPPPAATRDSQLSMCFSKLLSTLCNQPTTRRANHG